eukprot:scaffold3221_cov230-Prasinococcus_capsulatus_cf.AAC.1
MNFALEALVAGLPALAARQTTSATALCSACSRHCKPASARSSALRMGAWALPSTGSKIKYFKTNACKGA